MSELFEIDRWSEWCDSEDWKDIRDKQEDISVAWDPICVLPAGIVACWVFDRDSDAAVFVCGTTQGANRFGVTAYESKEISQLLYFRLCNSVRHVTRNTEVAFAGAMEHFCNLPIYSEIDTEDAKRCTWMSDYCSLVTRYDRNLKIVACIPKKARPGVGTSEGLTARKLMPTLQLNLTRYFMMNPTWKYVPTKYFCTSRNSPEQLFENFWSPKLFDPLTEPNGWLWPWQRLEPGSHSKSASIPTTSLCADIRLSSRAMEFTVQEADFARFIRDVVDEMKSIIQSFGGYFDKETGDGIIAHFLDEVDQNGATSAFKAAREIAREVGRICKNFVDASLSQKFNVDIGIGIHTGSAHWFTSDSQICAIGSSVVEANRICSGAGPGEVLLSLGAHRSTQTCKNAESAKVVRRKNIQFKGLDTEVEAYVMEL